MEVIKRRISLDDYITKTPDNWGAFEVKSFKIKLFITQDSDDMGVFTDLDFIPVNNSTPNYQILRDKLDNLGYTFNFMNGGVFYPQTTNDPNIRAPYKIHSDYFNFGGVVSGLTEDRLDVVKSYDSNFTYKPLFDMNKGLYLDYQGNMVDGVTRVNDNINNLSPITYSEDVDINDVNIGTINQNTGLFFITYGSEFREIKTNDLGIIEIPITQIYYKAQGFNESNTLLEANMKEEYLFGITNTPEVESDVFIDRGRTTILQGHLQLGEITNMGDLVNYGNGFYNIKK